MPLMRTAARLFILFTLLVRSFAQAQTPVSPAFAQALQEKLDSCVNVYSVPGISASILLPGDRFWNGASGLAHIYTAAPMDTAYLFQAASVTKLFVAAVAMQLVDEGSLSLDDTVGSFLPPLTYVPGDIKVRHLLKHRSGLAEFLANQSAPNSWLSTPTADWDPFATLETFGAPPTFSQGSQFAYSNTNYLLLGMIIEQVTGMPFHQALRTRILEPLGLDHAVFRPDEALPGSMVPGWSSLIMAGAYDQDMTGFLSYCYSSMVYTAGAMAFRPWDAARFNRALFTGAVIPPAVMDTMRTCTNVNMGGGATGYGFGTMRYVFSGRTYFGHGGDINGFTQLSIHNQPDSVTLVLSINRNGAPRGPIAAALLGVVFEQLTVGIAERRAVEPGFTLQPNPANDAVYVNWTGSEPADAIELLDATGRVVKRLGAPIATMQRIDLAGLSPGPYVVRVGNGGRMNSRQLIVQ